MWVTLVGCLVLVYLNTWNKSNKIHLAKQIHLNCYFPSSHLFLGDCDIQASTWQLKDTPLFSFSNLYYCRIHPLFLCILPPSVLSPPLLQSWWSWDFLYASHSTPKIHAQFLPSILLTLQFKQPFWSLLPLTFTVIKARVVQFPWHAFYLLFPLNGYF